MKKNLLLLCFLLAATPVLAQQSSDWTTEHFQKLDANQDSKISLAEYESYMQGAFARLDKDGNGTITIDEAAGVLTPNQFKNIDTNQDGKIDLEEFMAAVTADFHRQDRDGDQHLSR